MAFYFPGEPKRSPFSFKQTGLRFLSRKKTPKKTKKTNKQKWRFYLYTDSNNHQLECTWSLCVLVHRPGNTFRLYICTRARAFEWYMCSRGRGATSLEIVCLLCYWGRMRDTEGNWGLNEVFVSRHTGNVKHRSEMHNKHSTIITE